MLEVRSNYNQNNIIPFLEPNKNLDRNYNPEKQRDYQMGKRCWDKCTGRCKGNCVVACTWGCGRQAWQ